MKSRWLLILFLGLSVVFSAHAQTDRYEAALFTKMRLAQSAPMTENTLQNQFARVDQYFGTVQNDKQVVVHQQGNGNTAIVDAQAENSMYAVIQHVNANKHIGGNKGIANRTLLEQYGQGNTLINRTEGQGVSHHIVQQGKANYIEQEGLQEIPMKITQKGHGMKVIVEGR